MAVAVRVRGRIAVAQMCSTSAPEENLATVRRLLQQAAAAGCSVVSFPECFEWMGSGPTESLAFAQPLTGALFAKYRALARESAMWVSYGGFHERQDESSGPPSAATGDRIFNAHVLVAPDGEVVANYRKTHLFDVDTADGTFKESSFTAPGEELVVVEHTPVGTVGLTTCYDLRFPSVYANLRAAGASLILVPSAFMPSTGRAHWECLLRARAIETQCYVAAAAQFGAHNAKRSSYGHSIIIDPWGDVVASLGGQEEGIAIADVDPERIASVRDRMPVLNHARGDLYNRVVRVVRPETEPAAET